MKKNCNYCGKEFEKKVKHPEQVYCSVSCSVKDRRPPKQEKEKPIRHCVVCGAELIGAKIKYCSKVCFNKKALNDYYANFKSVRETNEYVTKRCKWCGKGYKTNYMASKREFCSDKCNKQFNKHQEHAKSRGLFVSNVCFIDIYERDQGVCGICGNVVDVTLHWKDKMSATLDHVIPLSKGGTHEPSNVQLAHRLCNSTKGDNIGTLGPLGSLQIFK